MPEARLNLLTRENAKFHANVEEYELRFPEGTCLVEEVTYDLAYMRISKEYYVSPEHLKDEIRFIWKRTWQYACAEDEVPNAGDFITYDVADQSFIVMRQVDGSLRAFHNTCQHRGSRLVDGSGNLKEIRCPFHGWAYRLDGDNVRIPDKHTFDCLDGDLSLRRVACEVWEGLVFINPDVNTKVDLKTFLGPVAEQLAPFRIGQTTLVKNTVSDLSSNWKTCVEAFVEIYHVNGVHPQFLLASDDVSPAFEILSDEYGHSRAIIPFGVASQRVSSYSEADIVRAFVHTGGVTYGAAIDLTGVAFERDAQRGLVGDPGATKTFKNAREFLIDFVHSRLEEREVDLSDLKPDEYIDDWHYFIAPGLVFNVGAGGFLLLSMRPHATDPDKCVIQTMLFQKLSRADRAKTRAAPRAFAREGEKDFGEILNQDYENVVRTQRGMHSDGFEASRLSRQEVRVAAFRRALDRKLEEGRAAQSPPS